MMIVRPIQDKDSDALWQIANQVGAGFTSLQPYRSMVNSKLEWAINSFNQNDGNTSKLEDAYYLFVLEDLESMTVVGTAGIEAAVGLNAPWYNYKVSMQVHASQQLNVYTTVNTLMLCSDHTGFSELCTLFLHPDYRHSRNGALLSKSRFLFIAAFPELFSSNIFAEMRGSCDVNEISPFWEALGRHFFAVDFKEADRHSTGDKAFIAELMPRHPIYTNLLPDDARNAIGKTHDSTLPARYMLENEGFHYTGYVDIFDAGPLLEARTQDIRAIRDSRDYKTRISDKPVKDNRLWLISNNKIDNFRSIIGSVSFDDKDFAYINRNQANALCVEEQQSLKIVSLSVNKGE